MPPLVSVVMTVAVPEPGVRRALHSALSQNYTDLEVLIVDSTGDDRVAELLRAIQDSRLRRIPVSPGIAPAAALNAGIRAASGELVGFQDAISEWLPLKLEMQLNIMKAQAAIEWVGGSWLGYCAGRAWGATPPSLMRDVPLNPNPLECMPMPLASWLVRRSALIESGLFDEQLPALHEWDIALRMIGRGKARFVFDNVALIHCNVASEVIPQSDSERNALQCLLERHQAVFQRHPQASTTWAAKLKKRPQRDTVEIKETGTKPDITTGEPLVTVVIPTHNRARLLRRAIISVLAQSHSNLELIVVDDASTDDTAATVRSIADPRLRYIRLEQNRRAAAARNIGILEAKGELVAFQDDDDIWLPQKLEIQVAALASAPSNVGLNLCSHIQLTRTDTVYVGGQRRFECIDFSRGMNWRFGMIATPAWLVRREVFSRAGNFDESMKAWDDWELALRLRDVCEFNYVDDPLFIQDQRRSPGTGMWDNQKLHANDMSVIMRKHEDRWKSQPEVLANHYLILGLSELMFHSKTAARRAFLRSFSVKPRQLKAPAYWLLSFFGRNAIHRVTPLIRTLHQGLLWLPRRLSQGVQ